MSAPVVPDKADPALCRFAPRNEVRFAVVMYGGISLAIYMNGIAQELLSLVRSTAPDYVEPPQMLLREHEIDGTEKVYRELAKAIWPNAASRNEIGTRFIVDILSGTSAGGMNGLFLANALVNESTLDPMTKLWIEEGEISKLLNDKESVEGVDHVSLEPQIQSLLNSDRMLRKLVDALNDFDYRSDVDAQGKTTKRPASNLVDELDLYMHATDLKGLSLPLEFGDGSISERRNRTTFHFRYAAQDTAPALPNWSVFRGKAQVGERPWNDFKRGNVPFFAFVSRCTSSIVPAFEPMRLDDLARVTPAGTYTLTKGQLAQGYDRNTAPFQYSLFFRDYWQNPQLSKLQGTELIESAVQAFAFRNFGDGGYLDNYPFTDAVDRLKARRADLPVDRKLLYVEPDPSLEESDELYIAQQDRINVVKHATLSRTLPWDQKIREEIQKLRDRNVLLDRVQQVMTDIKSVELDEEATSTKLKMLAIVRQAEPERKFDSIPVLTPAETAYLRLRIASTTDRITEILADAFGYDQDSRAYRAVSFLTKAWRDHQYPTVDGNLPADLSKYYDFLNAFDFDFRLRQIDFVNTSLNDLLELKQLTADKAREVGAKDEYLGDPETRSTHKDLIGLKTKLNEVQEKLRMVESEFSLSLRPMEQHDLNQGLSRAIEDLAKLAVIESGPTSLTTQDLYFVMEHDSDEGRYRAAQKLFGYDSKTPNVKGELLNSVGRTLAAFFGRELEKIDQEVVAVMQIQPRLDEVISYKIRASELKVYDRKKYLLPSKILGKFEQVDSATFPIVYGTGAIESRRVDVIRVSPQDAKSLVSDPGKAHVKLAGSGLGHFAGFFHPMWRREDILWGRLDSTERIICTMLPINRDDSGADMNAVPRSNLVLSAQLMILAQGKEAEGASKADVEIHADLRSDLLRKALDSWAAWVVPGSTGLSQAQDSLVIAEFCEKGFIEDGLTYAGPAGTTRFEPHRLVLQGLLTRRAAVTRTSQLYERPQLASTQELSLIGRSLNIAGKMSDYLGSANSGNPKVGQWIARLGSFIVGVAKVVTPGAMEGFWAKHWLSLLLFVGLVLGFGGMLLQNTVLEKYGWEIAGFSLLLFAVVWIATKDLNSKRPLARTTALAKAGALALVVLLGAYSTLVVLAYQTIGKLQKAHDFQALNGLAVYLIIVLSGLGILGIVSLFSPPIRKGPAMWKRALLAILVAAVLGMTAFVVYRENGDLLSLIGTAPLPSILWAFLLAFVVLLLILAIGDIWAFFSHRTIEKKKSELLEKALKLKSGP